MITHPVYAVEPWCLRETDLDLGVIAQSESLFALSNGHLGWRGNLDEGEPHGLPGCYLNGVYETHPLPYAEAGYGYPEAGQTVINVANGKIIRLLVDDEPFDVRYGRAARATNGCCDFRDGVLRRQVRLGITRPARALRSALASAGVAGPAFDRRHLLRGGSRSTSECGWCVQSELVANESMPEQQRRRPAQTGGAAGAAASRRNTPAMGRTRRAACTTPPAAGCGSARRHGSRDRRSDDTAGVQRKHARIWARVTITADAAARAAATGGQVRGLRLVGRALAPAAARSGRRRTGRGAAQSGWDGLLAEQRAYLDDFWDARRCRGRGRPAELQQAVRFALVPPPAGRCQGRARRSRRRG